MTTTIWMVEQLGLAMMPLCQSTSSGLTSGTTSGTSGSMRQAEELSTTTQPASRAMGANFVRGAAAGREQGQVDALEAVGSELLAGRLLSPR